MTSETRKKKLEALAAWDYTQNRVPCNKCIEFWKQQGKKPKCNECDKPKLLSENSFVYSLIIKYQNLFIDSMGGTSSQGIGFVLDIEQIHPHDKPLLTQKILAYISTGLKTHHDATIKSSQENK